MWETIDLEEWQKRGCPLLWRSGDTDDVAESAYGLRDHGSAPELDWRWLLENAWDADIRQFDSAFQRTSVRPAAPSRHVDLMGNTLTANLLLGHLETGLEPARRADAPALLLSGGLDSSILAVLTKTMDIPLTAYHIGAEDTPDGIAAKKIAKRLSMPLTFLDPAPDAVGQAMTSCTRLMEHPSPEFPFAGAALSGLQMIEGQHDVIINGEPADALLGGIRTFHDELSPDELSSQRSDAAHFLSPLSLLVQQRLAGSIGAQAVFPFFSSQLVADSLATPWPILNGLDRKPAVLGGSGFKFLLQQAADALEEPVLSEIARRPKLGLPATMAATIRRTLPQSSPWDRTTVLIALAGVAFEHTLVSDEDVPFHRFVESAMGRLSSVQ